MSILDSITTGALLAPKITLYGRPGVGKSTLASKFPDPVFLLTEENGLQDVRRLPFMESFKQVWSTVKELTEAPELPFKTLVIDSISKLDALVVQYILDTEPPNKHGQKPSSLNAACGGYGAGHAKAQLIMRSLKTMFDKLSSKGVTVVYVGHLDVVKYKAPDNDDYDIYTIVANHNKTREVFLDDVDLVGFCRLKSFMTETESGRALIKSTGDRVVHVGVNDGHVSKNRFNMPDELEMSFEAIAKHIPFFNQGESK